MQKPDVAMKDAAPVAESGSATAAVPVATETEPKTVEQKIDAWFAKHFHGLGPILEERVYNIIHAAKEELKAELAETRKL